MPDARFFDAAQPLSLATLCERTGAVLARGEVTKAFTVQAHKFSGKAAEKLAAAGGRAELIQAVVG